jgi:hypothetical protein
MHLSIYNDINYIERACFQAQLNRWLMPISKAIIGMTTNNPTNVQSAFKRW